MSRGLGQRDELFFEQSTKLQNDQRENESIR